MAGHHQHKKTYIREQKIAVTGNPNGELRGEHAVFTGEIELPRAEAAELAASAGITVDSNVTKKITILVVGVQDLSILARHSKSGKHRKAETYISNGQNIRIITERQFMALVATA